MSEAYITAIFVLVSTLLGGGISLLAVWFTNRHNERTARDARWWERRFEAYTEAIGLVETILDVCNALEFDGTSAPLVPEARQRYYDELFKAKKQLSIIHPKAHLVLSERSTEAIFNLIGAFLINNEPQPDHFEAIGAEAKNCRDWLIDEANQALGASPTRASRLAARQRELEFRNATRRDR